MQNKINLDTHNEVMPVSEPWHRGSGFTWMLLALAGALRNLSGDTTWSGAVTLGSGSRINSDSGTLTLSGGGFRFRQSSLPWW